MQGAPFDEDTVDDAHPKLANKFAGSHQRHRRRCLASGGVLDDRPLCASRAHFGISVRASGLVIATPAET
jgi:hypothetical protein